MEEDAVFALVGNIPHSYHASDLRNYFSQFIETNGFLCFHYKHRPAPNESQSSPHSTSTSGKSVNSLSDSNSMERDKRKCTSKCCLVKVKSSRMDNLLKMYHRKRWLDANGESLTSLCVISKIKFPSVTGISLIHYITRRERKQKARFHDGQQVNSHDTKNIPELNPPRNVMPRGNVGTPTLFFLRKIQKCCLPQRLIGQLGLKFPKTRAKRMYGDVPYNYGGTVCGGGGDEEEEEVLTADGHAILDARDAVAAPVRDDLTDEEEKEPERVESEEDGDDGEEWERHEALNDDPSNAERNKERCFEEEMEVVWEKGGSGIVWYTDAQYWKEKEGDFDEQTTDDLDVDMSVYYEPNGGDKDARDSVMMLRDKRRRRGISEELNDPTGRIGKFEKHTRGFGRQLMERHGWKDGEGLGPSVAGMKDALGSDGQKPRDKTGFGYRGEKLQRIGVRPPKRKVDGDEVIISTIYDKQEDTDPPEELMRRREPHHITHRAGSMRFHKALHPDEPV
ncbi:hypothetical protein CAPTEDRAFT_150255 [Capitella teleta]|uniref:G-patch domain-containing protein n=1 Tax=Capitella teleta TaxID=283909 RepID=R7T7Y4_CAPTE|nr:hypothetical protein CAPTEDRAFT_150255 [Capitella teleta]|eukprot:ELT87104.1 hypothetical protein CAPTEDRAFT_150255 [Capitella teleta]